MARIVEQIRSGNVPIIMFTKGGGAWLEAQADAGADALGLDWTVSIADARERVGARVALQGNLDPVALLGEPSRIEGQIRDILEQFGDAPGHVFNLGHGITPDVPPETVGHAIEMVHSISASIRASIRATGRDAGAGVQAPADGGGPQA
jgi:uroporphyrinogen decarboxylase